MIKGSKVLGVLCLLVVFALSPVVKAEEWERTDGGFFTLLDEAGKEITKTAWILDTGDRYIDEDNREYEVTSVVGDSVHTKYVGTVELPDVSDIVLSGGQTAVGQAAGRNTGVIAIYHTHSGESYVPTSGTPTEEWGDIYEVGQALKDALEEQGYEVVWSKNNHNPQDAEAYSRSRRTVLDLAKKRPVTMIDVHRDAIPAEAYETEVGGEKMTKVRLVVGRQNQNRQVNLEYAKRIKAVADKYLPGLVKGIFHARGNYNQDIGSRMMLIEVGTHENPLEEAKKAARAFAKVLPAAAGMTSPKAAAGANRNIAGASNRTLWWVLGIAVVAIVGFVLLNGGKLGSIGGFFSREAGALGGEKDEEDTDRDK